MHYKDTQYGFEFGAAKVQRLFSDKGAAYIEVKTPRGAVTIAITPTGFIRLGKVVRAETIRG